jgi:hypothetical protein
MKKRRLPFLQWASGVNALRKGELGHMIVQGVEDPLPTTRPQPFSICSRRGRTFHARFSAWTAHCIGHLFANSSRCARREKFYFCWVLHAMGMNHKAERVILSHGILSVLQSLHSTGFQSVITGDDSWSFCTILLIRYGRRDEMTCQKESVRKLTQKNV